MDGAAPSSNTVPLGRPLPQPYQTTQPMRMAHVPLPRRPPAPQHRRNGRVAGPRQTYAHYMFCIYTYMYVFTYAE